MTSNILKQRVSRWNVTIETCESFVISLLSRLVTWAAPLVPAIFVYSSAKSHIDNVNHYEALVIAAVVELLGLSVVSNWLDVKEYNRLSQINDKEPVSEAGTSWMLTFYVITVLCIVFGLKIAPETFIWLAVLSLSLMSLLSAIAFVQRRQHAARMDETREEIQAVIEAHKQAQKEAAEDKAFDKQLERERRLAEHRRHLAEIEGVTSDMSRHANRDIVTRDSDTVTNDSDTVTSDNDKVTMSRKNVTAKMTATQRRDKLLSQLLTLSSLSDIDYDKLADTFSVTKRTIRRDIETLSSNGHLSFS